MMAPAIFAFTWENVHYVQSERNRDDDDYQFLALDRDLCPLVNYVIQWKLNRIMAGKRPNHDSVTIMA
jgi:hypothetical protein